MSGQYLSSCTSAHEAHARDSVPNKDTTLPNPDPTKPRVFAPANVAYVPEAGLWSCIDLICP